jgi:hypothetical protein
VSYLDPETGETVHTCARCAHTEDEHHAAYIAGVPTMNEGWSRPCVGTDSQLAICDCTDFIASIPPTVTNPEVLLGLHGKPVEDE